MCTRTHVIELTVDYNNWFVTIIQITQT